MLREFESSVASIDAAADYLRISHQSVTVVERVQSSIDFLDNCLSEGLQLGAREQTPELDSLDDSRQSRLGDWWATHAQTPLQSPAWLMSWWEAYKSPAHQLRLLMVESNGQLRGLVPLCMKRSGCCVQVLHWLGSGKACTDFQSVVAAAGDQPLVQQALASWLLDRQQAGPWSMLELDGIADPNQLEPLLQRLSDAGCPLEQVARESTWRIDLSEGWAGFMAGLSKTQRAQARNLLNRFDKSQDYSFRVVRGAETATALESTIELHQRRWQAEGVTGCFADSRFRRFVERGVERLAQQDQAEVLLLESGGRAIGGLLCLCDRHGNRFVYQAGRDPNYEQARVGQMLNFVAVRDACERGLSFVDYLRGDELYKQRLGAQSTPCWRLRVFAPSWTSRLPYHAFRLCRQAKEQAATLCQFSRKWLGKKPHAK